MPLISFAYAVGSIISVTLIPAFIYLQFLYKSESSISQRYLVSLAIGSLLGNVVYHLIPEALGVKTEDYPSWTLTIFLSGMLVFLFGEQLLQQYHHGHGHTHYERTTQSEGDLHESQHSHNLPSHFGALLVSSDLLHSLVDGIAIGTAFLSSGLTGISTSIAVFSHEVPHLLGDYAVLVSTGFTRLKLFYYSCAIVGSSVGGALLVNVLHYTMKEGLREQVERGLLAFAAGNFLYISLSDLIPEVLVKQKDAEDSRFKLHYVLLLAGALSMLLLKLFMSE